MIILNGKKYYQKDINACHTIDCNGWNSYDGQYYQMYSLHYNPECGLVILEAYNSGDCFGDYFKKYYASPQEFVKAYGASEVSRLLGHIDENDKIAMEFSENITNR